MNMETHMLFSNSAKTTPQPRKDEAMPLFGRFMGADRQEHPCRVKALSVERMQFFTEAEMEQGENIVAYVDELGRLEGTAEQIEEDGFVLRLRLSSMMRERLEERLDWLRRKARGEGVEKRRYQRYKPRESKSHVLLEDGRSYRCEVIDISISGASVRCAVLPALGTRLTLGKTRGRVVRHHEEGFAIEFTRLLPMEVLKERIR